MDFIFVTKLLQSMLFLPRNRKYGTKVWALLQIMSYLLFHNLISESVWVLSASAKSEKFYENSMTFFNIFIFNIFANTYFIIYRCITILNLYTSSCNKFGHLEHSLIEDKHCSEFGQFLLFWVYLSFKLQELLLISYF